MLVHLFAVKDSNLKFSRLSHDNWVLIYLTLFSQTWGQDNSILKFIFGFVAAMCSPMIFCWYGTAIIENVSKNKFEELQKLQSFVSHFYYKYILELTMNWI
jgi:amino acid permease